MKRTWLMIGALMILGSARAQYFCTEQGTVLHYVNYDNAGQSLSDETFTVTDAGKDAQGKTYAHYLGKIVTTKSKNNTSYTRYNWSYDGKQTFSTEDLMYGPYINSDSDPDKYDEKARTAMLDELKWKGDNTLILADQAKAGTAMPDRTYSYIRSMLKNEVTVSGANYLGTERISTTAGKFDCTKISYIERTKIVLKSSSIRVTEWYAKGIGLVKRETFNMKGEPAGKTLLVSISR